jgi:CMP-N,N'-diacetyllegionaminic acid synthase
MFGPSRVLVVVPARGGSQGIPLKNLRTLGGVPLVALAGRLARQLDFVDRAVVSTDHPEIARVAREAGLDAPFQRPEALSGPLVSDLEVLSHALTELERSDGVRYDLVVMLQPTSPGRSAGHVRAAVEKLVEGGYDAVWTVSRTDGKAHPLKQLVIDAAGRLDYYDAAGAQVVARQQLAPVYHRNGVAYVVRRECLLEQKTLLGRRSGALVLEGHFPNIDTEFDLELAEFLAARGSARG